MIRAGSAWEASKEQWGWQHSSPHLAGSHSTGSAVGTRNDMLRTSFWAAWVEPQPWNPARQFRERDRGFELAELLSDAGVDSVSERQCCRASVRPMSNAEGSRITRSRGWPSRAATDVGAAAPQRPRSWCPSGLYAAMRRWQASTAYIDRRPPESSGMATIVSQFFRNESSESTPFAISVVVVS